MPTKPRATKLDVRPLTRDRVDDLKTITSSTFGANCWDVWWRYRKDQWVDAGIAGGTKEQNTERRREILRTLARRRHAPVLVAYEDGVPLGFVSLEYARDHGAPAIEGYPRPDERRFSDGAVFMGTEELFRRARFRKIRGVLPGLARPWAPRVTMRASCGPTKRTSSRLPRRSPAAR